MIFCSYRLEELAHCREEFRHRLCRTAAPRVVIRYGISYGWTNRCGSESHMLLNKL